LTQVKYNAEGDLLISCIKDHNVCLWNSLTGERIGTYEGHNGTVWTTDIDSTSTLLVTGSADNQVRLWEASTGKCIKVWEIPTAIKRVAFSEDDSRILAVTEARMGFSGTIRIFDIAPLGQAQPDEPSVIIDCSRSKATVASFTALDKYIVAAHEDGSIAQWDPKSGKEIKRVDRVHEAQVMDMQMSLDGTYFITASRDKSAKLIDSETLETIKSYVTHTPLNSAALLPDKPYLLLGGGQDAMNVTTTGTRQGQFEIRFWHKVFEEELASVKGGFGPCNTLAAHPQGTGYTIGGEDGYVRVHHFDEDFGRQRPYGPDMDAEN